jgi:glycosyltransferase involved in cell wall biosynthesis
MGAEAFRGGAVQALHDRFHPEAVVAAGGYHAARVVAALSSDAPRFVDLPGDLAAEAQLRAERGGAEAARDALATLALALSVADGFAVVGPSQRLALLGQLGLAGRLTRDVIGDDPVAIVPVACEGPDAAPPLPVEGFQVLWSGSYNTWMDGATLLEALERAAERVPRLRFVATGGPVPGHDESSYAAFWQAARASRSAARLDDLGRLPRPEALAALAASHVVVCVSRPCLEAELGSRLRVVEALAHGRPVVLTDAGDLAREVAEAGAGLLVPAGDAGALAAALVLLAEDRERLAACGRRGRELWQARFGYDATTRALCDWLAAPRRWPRSVLAEPQAAEERIRLQSELDALRASRTFRALRLLDRLTGRTRA